jgi:transposase
MFVALELSMSKSSWLVALHSPVADKVSLHRFIGGDVTGLLALIARQQTQAEARLGRAIRVQSCYEAGYDGFWLHRLLCARGIDNRILDAASILVDRRSRRAKTDRLDVAGLLRTLMALDPGESRVCRVVRVPSVAQEDARRRSRERTRLVVERGQHSNRIKGVLMTLGVRDFKPTRRDWQECLGGLRTADGQELPACLKAEITRECRRLHQVIVMIAEVEAEQAAALEAEKGQAARLIRLRGIGLVIATVLADEVFFRDFRNRREVAGYLGLASSPWASGRVQRDQGITKSGNPRARRTADRHGVDASRISASHAVTASKVGVTAFSCLLPGARRRNIDKPWLDLVCAGRITASKSPTSAIYSRSSCGSTRSLIWNGYHFGMQNFGVLSLAGSSRVAPAPSDRNVTLPCRHGRWYVRPANARRLHSH